MIEVNEYFDGKVKSLGGFQAGELGATVGVMDEGEYEFSTGTKEYMTVITGELSVRLEDSEEWVVYGEGKTFEVAGNSSFLVKVGQASSYLCRYK